MLVTMFVDFRWSLKFSLRIGVLEEQDGAVAVVSWLLTSCLSFQLLQYIATPLQRTGYFVPHGVV